MSSKLNTWFITMTSLTLLVLFQRKWLDRSLGITIAIFSLLQFFFLFGHPNSKWSFWTRDQIRAEAVQHWESNPRQHASAPEMPPIPLHHSVNSSFAHFKMGLFVLIAFSFRSSLSLRILTFVFYISYEYFSWFFFGLFTLFIVFFITQKFLFCFVL